MINKYVELSTFSSFRLFLMSGVDRNNRQEYQPAVVSQRGLSGRPRCTLERHEANLNPLVQPGGDAPEHRERVAVVVGILKTADHRRRSSHDLRERGLGEAGLHAEVVELASDFGIRELR